MENEEQDLEFNKQKNESEEIRDQIEHFYKEFAYNLQIYDPLDREIQT